MKQKITRLLQSILLLLSTFFNSCTDMKSQTEEVINLNREKMNADIKALQQQQIITSKEANQIAERLNADLDYYLWHQDIDLPGLEKRFFETVNSFENIEITQPIFAVISGTYYMITGSISVKDYPKISKENFEVQPKLNTIMNNWFDNYQNDTEKIADLIAQINKQKELKIYTDISLTEYDEMISTITRIKNDTAISNDELRKIVTDGMLKYCNKSNESNLAILNIYAGIDRIKKLGIDKELSEIYQQKWTKPKEPDYSEIKQQTSSRFQMLLSEEMITKQEFTFYTKTIVGDVAFCEKNKDKALIKTQLLSSLKKLKMAELDTEDREAIVDWYFLLSQKSKIDIKNDLNKWLYDFETN